MFNIDSRGEQKNIKITEISLSRSKHYSYFDIFLFYLKNLSSGTHIFKIGLSYKDYFHEFFSFNLLL